MIIKSTTRLTATNLSDPLMEANEMLTVYSFSVQRELKLTVVEWHRMLPFCSDKFGHLVMLTWDKTIFVLQVIRNKGNFEFTKLTEILLISTSFERESSLSFIVPLSGDNWTNYKTYQPQTLFAPLVEVKEMLTVCSFIVQKELKPTVCCTIFIELHTGMCKFA